MVVHSGLVGSDLHEPKGIGTAQQGYVYVASGDGLTGAWTKIPQGDFTIRTTVYTHTATWTRPSPATDYIGTLAVCIGAGGGASRNGAPLGSNGGTSSFNGISAQGGRAGKNTGHGDGGTVNAGDATFAGNSYSERSAFNRSCPGLVINDIYGFGSLGIGGVTIFQGGGAGASIGWSSDASSTEQVVVGAGGAQGPSGISSGEGLDGVVILYDYIKA